MDFGLPAPFESQNRGGQRWCSVACVARLFTKDPAATWSNLLLHSLLAGAISFRFATRWPFITNRYFDMFCNLYPATQLGDFAQWQVCHEDESLFLTCDGLWPPCHLATLRPFMPVKVVATGLVHRSCWQRCWNLVPGLWENGTGGVSSHTLDPHLTSSEWLVNIPHSFDIPIRSF